MSKFKEKSQNDVPELRENLKSMSVDMRMFSLAMRSLYVDKEVGTSTEPARKIRKLCDNTRNDAMVYLKGVLPLSTKIVASISENFEYYEALGYNEWCEMLSDILQETISYRELCVTLVKMHEDILVSLRNRRDETSIVARELKALKGLKDLKKELKKVKETPPGLANGLAFIPFVGAIASPALAAAADLDLTAVITVSETIIPFKRGLEAFIDAIDKTTEELRHFEGIAEKGQKNPKLLYYKVMNKEAKDMKSTFQVFSAVLPDVRTDFLAIPPEGTDQNFVDRWLEKQKNTIKDNCEPGALANKLLAAITVDGQ